MNYIVYWLKKPKHSNVLEEGYVGITSNLTDRLWQHRNRGNNPMVRNLLAQKSSEVKILKQNLTLTDALAIERSLRPYENIGYNIIPGGSMPPSQKGKRTKGAQLLIGKKRTIAQKLASVKHSETMKGRVSPLRGREGHGKGCGVKPCIYKGKQFASMTEAAEHFGVGVSAVCQWVKRNGI